MGKVILGVAIGWLLRSLLQWRANYRMSKTIGEIRDGMCKHKEKMTELGKKVSNTNEVIKEVIKEVRNQSNT